MLKARNRKLSMILVLAMLMTMFAGLGTASAASIDYSGVNYPTYKADAQNVQAQPAKMSVELSNLNLIDGKEAAPTIFSVQLPSNVKFVADDSNPDKASKVGVKYQGEKANVGGYALIKSASTVDVFVYNNDAASEKDTEFMLTFENLLVKSGSGDLSVTVAGEDSTFPTGIVKIATISSSGTTMTKAGSVANFGEDGGYIDGITIMELATGVLAEDDTITFKLNKGFTWDNIGNTVVGGGWNFDGITNIGEDGGAVLNGTSAKFTLAKGGNDREVVLTINELGDQSSRGRITIGTDGFNYGVPALGGFTLKQVFGDDLYLKVNVEDTAKFGDVTVTVSSNNDDVAEDKIVVATYGDYDVKIVEGTTEEVISGRTDQEIGKFTIEEAIAGSIVANRSIKLELPSGCKWVDGAYPDFKLLDGNIDLGTAELVKGSSDRAIKVLVKGFSDEPSEIEIKGGEIAVSPAFEGDVELTISGSVGLEGSVVVAKAIKPVVLKSENLTDVVIGDTNQAAGNIVITENMAEAIMDGKYNNEILITLPNGVTFDGKPVVEVTEGDLEIDSYKLTNKDNDLLITIDATSTEASTITISEIFLIVDRTVPEGPITATFVALDEDDLDDYYDDSDYLGTDVDTFDANVTGCNALVEWNTTDAIGSVIVAETVTPAPGETVGSCEFRIGSNIYYAAGVAKVMDVAPYIKGDRTYVPMRYMGEALGAEVVWDDAARTVTLTKGETTVVFTIGSTSYTVNGEALTADVAPEIANDRTMLPARFVAEAFGAVVGWDAATQTVLITK